MMNYQILAQFTCINERFTTCHSQSTWRQERQSRRIPSDGQHTALPSNVAAYCNSVSGKNWVHFIAYDAEKSDTTSESSLLENFGKENHQLDRTSSTHIKMSCTAELRQQRLVVRFNNLYHMFWYCSQPDTTHKWEIGNGDVPCMTLIKGAGSLQYEADECPQPLASLRNGR